MYNIVNMYNRVQICTTMYYIFVQLCITIYNVYNYVQVRNQPGTIQDREVLVSLSGSPVVGVTARTTKAVEEQAVLVPLGKGETLCVPLGEDMDTRVDHLDQDQLDRLQELQQSLAIMLKSRREEES